RRGGQKNEGMAVTLFRRIDRPFVIDLPEIAAIVAVAMAVPEKAHAVIDDIGSTRKAEQVADRVAMDHARRRMNAANRVVGLQRHSAPVEVVETAFRIDRGDLEKAEQFVRA